MKHGQLVHVGGTPAASIERLAKWWAAATQAERFAIVKAAIEGQSEAPPLKDLHLAQYLAETCLRPEIGEG